jgi:hypothetical protein
MWTMTPPRQMDVTPHTFIGVSLAVLGVVLTLDNLGFVDARAVLRFWPLVPMLVGAVYVVQGRELRDWVLGGAWLAIGTAFLLRNLEVFHFRLVDFLPLILVAIGLKFMFGRRDPRPRPWAGTPDPSQPPPPPGVPPSYGGAGEVAYPPPFDPFPPGGAGSAGGAADPPAPPYRRGWSSGGAPAGAPWAGHAGWHGRSDVLRVFAMLSGADRRHRGALAHLEAAAVMGGCDIDLREAAPSADPLVIQVFAMWGGIEIHVPPGWLIQNEAWPILGGIVDNTTPPAVPTHRVILRGNAFMGGVELKN